MTRNTFIKTMRFYNDKNNIICLQSTSTDGIELIYNVTHCYMIELSYCNKNKIVDRFDKIEITYDNKIKFINGLTDEYTLLDLNNINKIISFRRLVRE